MPTRILSKDDVARLKEAEIVHTYRLDVGKNMKRLTAIIILAACIAFVGCSRTKIVPLDEAHMSGAAFLQSSVTVKAGQPVKFIDNPDGAQHILVGGTNGSDAPPQRAPDQLPVAGLTITPGTTDQIVFATAGTYTVTCTIHPSMLLTVNVTP